MGTVYLCRNSRTARSTSLSARESDADGEEARLARPFHGWGHRSRGSVFRSHNAEQQQCSPNEYRSNHSRASYRGFPVTPPEILLGLKSNPFLFSDTGSLLIG